MHQVDVCFAIPATLVIATNARGDARALAAAALCLLAIPWIPATQFQHLFLLSVFTCALIVWRLQIPLISAATILAAIGVSLYAFGLYPTTLEFGRGPLDVPPDALSVTAWQVIAENTRAPVAPWLAIKIPTWLGLGTVLGLAWLMRHPKRHTVTA
jgi:hypothetical protein